MYLREKPEKNTEEVDDDLEALGEELEEGFAEESEEEEEE